VAQKWYEKATVQAAGIGAAVAGVLTIVGGMVTAKLQAPPQVTAVFGDVPQAFSTLAPVAGGGTAFAAPATIDPTEAGAQLQFKSETVMSELQCISSGAQGVGPHRDVTITARCEGTS